MSENMSNGFDNDLDAFLNFDPPENTMSSTGDVKPSLALLHENSDFGSNASTFSAPSYQYDSHRQQTGLPIGAYQNTLAINQATGLHYRQGSHFVMPTQTLNMPLSDLNDYDFSRPLDSGDMDFDNDSPADVPSMFYNADGQSSMSPAAVVPPRIYPGMHTQQANQAKIQAAQKQQELLKSQRQMPAGQQPLPTSMPQMPVPTSTVKDPHIEESISRLLNRMRQNSTASVDDDEDSPNNTGSSRIKKDEDDMDEDERLLNSEEGKKLSSKERRQLRNKVSARAFRSRRKEYITQLEAEVAAKAQDANELRIQNRQLLEENTRLTDLTRMLLSSNSFAGFLQELSQSGVPNTASRTVPSMPQQSQPQQQQQQSRKDVSNHEASRQLQSQNHMHVGMAMIPETPIDMASFDSQLPWNNNQNEFLAFAVTELPEPPVFDFSSLNDKSTITSTPKAISKDLPIIPQRLILSETETDLYSQDSFVQMELPRELSIALCKAELMSTLRTTTSASPGTATQLEELCDELDKGCESILRLLR